MINLFDLYYAWYVKTMEIWFDLKAMQNLINATIKRVDQLEKDRWT